MNKARLKQLMLAIIIVLLSTKFGMAESSKEFAIMAKETWSAFECSVLAEKSKNIKEQERLFMFGYKEGLKFIDALKSEKIKGKDISSTAPLGMVLRLQGPTPDFMLGRVFEGAADSALENVFKTEEKFNSDEAQETIAANEFRKRNCQLIGKIK